ncbi:MAG: hypothetical protein ACLQLC_07420 [Candidatus Sulfotelmatobacter sp.]
MKALSISICSTVLIVGLAAAQDTTPKITIAPGSVIPVSLTKTVDAKKAKSGDEVQAKVTENLKTSSGEVLLPKDTKIVGHVTASQARSKEQKESQLVITFDHAVLKSGNQMQMPMSIQAIIAPPSTNPGNDQQSGVTGGVSPGGMPAGSSSGRSPATGGSAMPPAQNMPAGDSASTSSQTGSARPPITGDTKGVVGIPDLTLAAAPSDQGSLITSDKNNVKIESGTLMLLRVN